MQVWKLITHHEDPKRMRVWAEENGRIAVGWGKIGDLRKSGPSGGPDIGRMIADTYPELSNAHTGGPSLWSFFTRMKEGDLVLLAGKGKRSGVFEVTGPYFWASEADSDGDYQHQRRAVPTSLDPDLLWRTFGSDVAGGEAVRWTVALCGSLGNESLPADSPTIYSEGTRYEVSATRVERRAKARQDCIRHHGVECAVCDLDFGERYGEIGRGFIHVHHRNPFSESEGEREVDPVKDLVPLCPNCHAMAHRERPPIKVELLRVLYRRDK